MKQFIVSHMNKIVTICCAAASALLLGMLVYLCVTPNVQISKKDETEDYERIEAYDVQELSAEDTPLGVIKEYCWEIEEAPGHGACLGFYISHQYADVYIGQELVYRIRPSEELFFGKTIGCDWVLIPIQETDGGKEIRVLLTPIYEKLRDWEPEFILGTSLSIYKKQIGEDIFRIICAILSIVVGALFSAQRVWRLLQKKKDGFQPELGFFSILLGIWMLTYIESAPLLFRGQPMLVLGMPMTANAEHFEGSDNWVVKFTGDAMTSNFKSSDAANEVLTNLQPGDSIDLQINLENASNGKTDWYMTNEVIKTLEDSNNSAQGGAYTYILSYKSPDGAETVIYSSDVVGGEDAARANTDEGLHEATNTLEDHFFLDRLNAGEKASVHLFVGLDGETQGNAYQDTLAKLQMNFAVEKVYPRTKTVDKTEVVDREIVKSVKTGDATPIILFSVLTLTSGLLLLLIAVRQMTKNRRRRER